MCNAPLDALMCPLQIINWHWIPIINPSLCKHTLYPPPIQSWKLLDQSENLKFSTWFSIHLEIFWHGFQHTLKFSTQFQDALKFSTLFSTCLEIFKFFNMFSAHFKLENLKHLHSNCNWTHPENCVKSYLTLYVLWMLWIQIIHNN